MELLWNIVGLFRSSSPYRYSLEDLENMERKAKMEDNTENQLHALMDKTIRKKSSMPVLGGRMTVAGGMLGQGQKEEAYDIPATSVRRPVFARTITTQPEEDKVGKQPPLSCVHYVTSHPETSTSFI